MTVTYAKDHNSTLLLVLPRYHKWMRLWVSLGSGCQKGSTIGMAWKTWEVFSRASHLGILNSLRWKSQPVVLGLQTSPQHVPLPRVLRPHREGHTFWHQITGRTRWSYFVPVTVCTQHTESAQASQFSPNIIAQLSANRSQLESIPVCIFIFGQLLLTERVPCIQFVQRHNLSQFITILRFGLVSLVCPHIV